MPPHLLPQDLQVALDALAAATAQLEAIAAAPPPEPAIAAHARPEMGRVSFALSSGFVPFTVGAQRPLAALVNPADSGVDLYFARGEFSCSVEGARFRRWTGPASSVTAVKNPRAPGNLSGGRASKVRMYVGSDFVPGAGAVESKHAHIGPVTYKANLDGVRVWPGRAIYWTLEAGRTPGLGGGDLDGVVYLEWWEEPAAG